MGSDGSAAYQRRTQHYDPKIAGTSDGGVVVAWTEGFGQTTNVKVQKLDPNGNPVWPRPVLFHEPGYQFFLSDMHAADNGSVIVSLVIEQGFFSNHQLLTNKISATGKKLWGKNNVVIFDQGSLQFGNFPYFILDGSGGAVFPGTRAVRRCNVSRNISARMGARRFRTTGRRVRPT